MMHDSCPGHPISENRPSKFTLPQAKMLKPYFHFNQAYYHIPNDIKKVCGALEELKPRRGNLKET